MSGERPQDWVKWLPLVEWWYNSTFHTAIHKTLYEALYRQTLPSHMLYLVGASLVATANRHRTGKQFEVEDLVYLKLQPYRKYSVRRLMNQKLAPRFFGSFKVEKKIGKVPYKLQLPQGSRVHPTFHEPVRILDRRMVKHGNAAVTEVLVKWENSFPEDTIWEHF
ncbi:BSD domain-containing protein 1-A-like [Gossypium australe]|uniref:BSD domain-containing protein 1-A-like n=1 Tax=Gossypium australe TaxID=47621 RepID=A0A5B6WCY3_9ROSI|nr:BSD domain-containing protein 1-A-like [Gossypium australe]